ncbi:DUF3489 domain-containing protein [Lysobacter sp. K5869]|uniref:DUF3489 domain-containing protein n=1 Tax=Lysobacter sp. K5869 TaxID=2820808 RepID=UPI001C0645AC|nr:DUF3489 domain-containing protein [Lysobacter sp. K5869]QWP77505.1 DUF3489 domain-containing protein [Lysobacter sp. K5869]
MTTIELSGNQRTVLEMARDTGGYIEHYPTGLLGGARTSVVRALLRNELVEAHDAGYRITTAGYAAIGVEPPMDADTTGTEAPATQNLSEPSAPGLPEETASSAPVAPSKRERAARGDTKLTTVVGLLMRPEGATIAQIMAATDWQQHSVRGFLAGTVKKKGYTLTNSKEGDGERVYRIATEEALGAPADVTAHGDEEE